MGPMTFFQCGVVVTRQSLVIDNSLFNPFKAVTIHFTPHSPSHRHQQTRVLSCHPCVSMLSLNDVLGPFLLGLVFSSMCGALFTLDVDRPDKTEAVYTA